jgi:tryptophan-rich sensory protein
LTDAGAGAAMASRTTPGIRPEGMMDEKWIALIGFVVACFAAASSASLALPGPWYRRLAKPVWTPPDWMFGPVWTVLYAMIAVSGWLVWQAVGLWHAAFLVYALQLLLNGLWSFIFFKFQRIGLATADAVGLWLSIALNIAVFWPISSTAALLLVPYLAWVTVATALTATIWKMNPEERSAQRA